MSKQHPSNSRPKKGELLEVNVHALAYGGEGIARHDGFVLFVPHTAPGDRVRVLVENTKKNFGEARLIQIIDPAPTRREAPCPLFTTCGGCAWQHLSIEEQRHWKSQAVRDALRPVVGAADAIIHPIVESPDTWRYRNKMEFTFLRATGGKLVGGFHKPGNWREILDAEKCWLGPESMERILRAAIAEGERQGVSAWDPRDHRGTLRQLVVRHSTTENKLLVQLLTGDKNLDFPAMADALRAAEPTLAGIMWGLNDNRSDVARASEVLSAQGDESFEERLGRFRFRVSLASFFQTNSRGAERLYSIAMEQLQLTGNERLLDAYCGTGTIGIFCSDQVRELYGIEIIQEAVWDARENAARNGVQNATFMAGDMAATLPSLLGAVPGRFDRLVVDPPRSGMEKKALQMLLNLRSPRVVYVSCNPTTMARDLEVAIAAGYRLESVTPVDMFPQTYHVECVAALSLPTC